jgi:hypothetical protein
MYFRENNDYLVLLTKGHLSYQWQDINAKLWCHTCSLYNTKTKTIPFSVNQSNVQFHLSLPLTSFLQFLQ